MAPSAGLFSRIRTSTLGKSSTPTHVDNSNSTRTSSKPNAENVAPQVILTNDDTGSEYALSPAGDPRSSLSIRTGSTGGSDSAVPDEPIKSRPTVSLSLPLSHPNFPSPPAQDVLTLRNPQHQAPSDMTLIPRANLDLPPIPTGSVSPASLDQPQQKSPSRKSSLASIVLRRQNSQQSLNGIAPAVPAVPAMPAVPGIPFASRPGSLGAGVPDSDSVSIRSSKSSAGKKKRWSGKKSLPPSTGTGGALTISGGSVTSPIAIGPQSPNLGRVPSKPNKSPPKNGHVARTSIDSVLLPRRDAYASPRSSEDAGPFPEELSDDVYDSPDAFSFQEDDIPVTGFAVASSKRNADFHELFPEIAQGDYLIEGM
jgi:hypothetical protein